MQFPNFEFVITEEKYQQFIAVSDDRHQLHVNSEYAKSKGFNDVVVHGNILNCILSNIVGMKLGFEHVMIINQSINYRKPIYINDHLNVELSLKEEIAFLPGLDLAFKFFRGEELIANGTIFIKTAL
jgi:3-oxoacyl-[acyl-carrier protein] reductase